MNDLSSDRLLEMAETLENQCEAIVADQVKAFEESGLTADEYSPSELDGGHFQLAQALLTAVLTTLREQHGIKLTSEWAFHCEHNPMVESYRRTKEAATA